MSQEPEWYHSAPIKWNNTLFTLIATAAGKGHGYTRRTCRRRQLVGEPGIYGHIQLDLTLPPTQRANSSRCRGQANRAIDAYPMWRCHHEHVRSGSGTTPAKLFHGPACGEPALGIGIQGADEWHAMRSNTGEYNSGHIVSFLT